MNPSKTYNLGRFVRASRKQRRLPEVAEAYIRDKRGQSGIEFALLLPLMALLVAGTMDLGLGLMIRRKINQIASITSEIVSQEDAWPTSGVTSVLKGGALVLNPFDTTNLKIVVSVLDFDANGKATVNWSRGFQTQGLVRGSAWTGPFPEDIIEKDVQLVVTNVEYNAKSALTGLLSALTGIEVYKFTGTSMTRPRVGDRVKTY